MKISDGSGIRDPQFEALRIETTRTDRALAIRTGDREDKQTNSEIQIYA